MPVIVGLTITLFSIMHVGSTRTVFVFGVVATVPRPRRTLFWLVSKPLSPLVVVWTPLIGSRLIQRMVQPLIRIWTPSVISSQPSVRQLATLARPFLLIRLATFISLNQQGASAPTFSGNPDMKTKKRTEAELKAMAYAIADEVETRAEAIWQRSPKLTYAQCQTLALQQMLK